MRSTPVPAGNIKLRGKKTRPLSCMCCVAVNFKDMIREKEADREIKNFKEGKDDGTDRI